jgi:hypothetical protein
VVIWEKWRLERHASRGVQKLFFRGIAKFYLDQVFDKPCKIIFLIDLPTRVSGRVLGSNSKVVPDLFCCEST